MSQFSDSIFKFDGTKRPDFAGRFFNQNPFSRFEKGEAPHVRKRGFLGTKSYYYDPVTPKLNKASEGLREGATRMGGEAMQFMDEEQGKWLEANTRDIREAFVADKLKASKDSRVEAMEDLGNLEGSGRVSNTAEARKNFDRRIQGFRRARKKLTIAKEQGKALGSNVQFDATGYEMLDPSIDKFYDEFDSMIEERRNAYAQKYSNVDYADLNQGFSNIEGVAGANDAALEAYMQEFSPLLDGTDPSEVEEADMIEYLRGYADIANRAGTQDIDAMVLQDLIGTNASESAFLETSGIAELDGFMATTLETVREGYAKTFSGAYEGANTRAEMEDQNRLEYANTVERETNATLQMGRKRNEESIANQISDIRDAERIAQKTLDAQTSALTDVPGSSKKKVKGVDMQEGRPE